MALRRRSGAGSGSSVWPGFVDAMSAMLLVLSFVLSIFMIMQYVLSETITGQEETITGQDAAIATLASRLDSLSDILSLERREKAEVEGRALRLGANLAERTSERDTLEERVSSLTQSLAQSEEGRADLDAELALEREQLAREAAERRAIEALTASLEQDLTTSRAELEASEAALDEVATLLSDEERAKAVEVAAAEALRERLAGAETELTAMELQLDERRKEAEETLTLLAGAQAAGENATRAASDREALLKAAREELAKLESSSEEEQRQVALLNEQTRALRAQLASVQAQLATVEVERDETAEGDAATIEELGERLNVALAERNDALQGEREALAERNKALESEQEALAERNEALEQASAALERESEALAAQVDELENFRSEFFGRVRDAVADRDDVSVVGDRFVFQSEVLFGAGSARLGEAGRRELAKFAEVLNGIAGEIPEDIDWILRIDGHTDVLPVNTARSPYRNNWELSQARALSVAEFLINERGVPPKRLAPTGFGEFRPLDPARNREAYARNRRIELKLTER